MNFDPSTGINCISTIFGLTYKGDVDPTDNGIGAFEDPTTGKFYRTRNKVLVGVSIPIPFYEETPHMSRADIENKLVTCAIQDMHGNWYADIPVVDLGPGEHDELIRSNDGPHLLDRTYALCQMMAAKGNRMDNIPIAFWLIKDGTPFVIQGQNTPYKWI